MPSGKQQKSCIPFGNHNYTNNNTHELHHYEYCLGSLSLWLLTKTKRNTLLQIIMLLLQYFSNQMPHQCL